MIRLNYTSRQFNVVINGAATYRAAQKSKPLPNDQTIVLKPVIEISFSRQIKV